MEKREATIERLTAAFTEGLLPMEEFERRVELANRTEESEALRSLTADLPRVQGDRPPERTKRNSTGTYLINEGKAPTKDEVVSIFSSVQRTGNWAAPRKLDAVALFGSSHVDLRDALLPRDGIKIDAVAIFGSVSIIVPEGVNLRVRNVAIFGSAGGGGNRLEDEDAPTIEIEAVGIFGSANVLIKRR
jgi:hypothetical protein